MNMASGEESARQGEDAEKAEEDERGGTSETSKARSRGSGDAHTSCFPTARAPTYVVSAGGRTQREVSVVDVIYDFDAALPLVAVGEKDAVAIPLRLHILGPALGREVDQDRVGAWLILHGQTVFLLLLAAEATRLAIPHVDDDAGQVDHQLALAARVVGVAVPAGPEIARRTWGLCSCLWRRGRRHADAAAQERGEDAAPSGRRACDTSRAWQREARVAAATPSNAEDSDGEERGEHHGPASLRHLRHESDMAEPSRHNKNAVVVFSLLVYKKS
mmetsp:Transcript_52148/g.145543  ORF Transcript_52148/g.145543 Transcript_52148/m.145543 type:complete len:275 (-) Transcript_52148:52-876(-)